MKYNYNRHIKLLKQKEPLKIENKSFYKENRKDDIELSIYNKFVEENIFWQQRYKVDELIQEFFDRKINPEGLCDRVFGLRNSLIFETETFLNKLITGEVNTFEPNLNSKKLSGVLDTLFCECDYFIKDYENDQFSDIMENAFLKFQKALNED